ncbi:hypothetical protein JOQ06_027910, partial [Pogonophryne albipinna]
RDELIIGSNVIRPMIQKMKSDEKYWELISSSTSDPECEQFLPMLSGITRWPEDLHIFQGVNRSQADQPAEPVFNPETTCSPLQQLKECGL